MPAASSKIQLPAVSRSTAGSAPKWPSRSRRTDSAMPEIPLAVSRPAAAGPSGRAKDARKSTPPAAVSESATTAVLSQPGGAPSSGSSRLSRPVKRPA
jgi:hypothetical protein